MVKKEVFEWTRMDRKLCHDWDYWDSIL